MVDAGLWRLLSVVLYAKRNRLSLWMYLLRIVGVILKEESHSQRAETGLGSSSLTDGTDKLRGATDPGCRK